MKSVLVVDDDPYVLDLVSRFLKNKGLSVISTTDPERAYMAAERDRPDLIISDIAMPGIDGFTLFKGLKSNRVTQQIPLILLTGSDLVADVEEGFSAGAEAYLLKPVDWASAWPKIEALLQRDAVGE